MICAYRIGGINFKTHHDSVFFFFLFLFIALMDTSNIIRCYECLHVLFCDINFQTYIE